VQRVRRRPRTPLRLREAVAALVLVVLVAFTATMLFSLMTAAVSWLGQLSRGWRSLPRFGYCTCWLTRLEREIDSGRTARPTTAVGVGLWPLTERRKGEGHLFCFEGDLLCRECAVDYGVFYCLRRWWRGCSSSPPFASCFSSGIPERSGGSRAGAIMGPGRLVWPRLRPFVYT
jgi:hypothetical protein